MKVKLTSILLVTAMLLALLAGCGSGDTPATPNTPSTPSTPGSTEPSGDGEIPTLTAIVAHVSNEDNFPLPVLDQIAEEAGVKIEWQIVSNADWVTQKSIILGGGDLPDIFFATRLDDVDMTTGNFIDMSPYLDQMPNVSEFLNSSADAKTMATTLDGKIYGLPSQLALRPYSGDVLYVNKTWCDKLNIPLPTTTDEFFDMLIRFRDEDPNGNGIADEIGITGYGGGTANTDFLTLGGLFGWAFPAFGVVMNQSDTFCMVQDGKPVFMPVTDNYRACVEYLNKMWNENLLDHEFFSLGFNEQAAKYRSDPLTVGAGCGWTKETNAAEQADNYVYIEPLTGPFGDKYWNASSFYNKLYDNRAAVTTSCKNVEAAIRFIDLCYDQWNSLQIGYGSDGIVVAKDENGNPYFLDPPEGMTSDEWSMNNSLGVGAPGWASDEFSATIGGSNSTIDKFEIDKFYTQWALPESRMPYVNYTDSDMAELAILRTDINTYVMQSLTSFVTNGVTDESWNAYVDQLQRMDLDRLMEIYTNGYNSVMG